ncbi:MAG: glycosyltransferase [Proteobacteria bacterium]|nr:glycosyltransferase [Pseudomonadota bacterium]
MQSLAAVQADVPLTPPLVSIIVPACNEEATVEPALRSLFQQDYPNLEVIVIDDRSTDGTYGLLTNLAQQFPEMRVEQITELPPEWLVKIMRYIGEQGRPGARSCSLLMLILSWNRQLSVGL